MKDINEWMNVRRASVDEAVGYFEQKRKTGLFATQKEVDKARKDLLQTLSRIVAMRKGDEWEFSVPDMMYTMVDEWNRMLESQKANPELAIMKYQGVLVDCLKALWVSLALLSVGRDINTGHKFLTTFTKMAKTLYRIYDKVLLVKPAVVKL